MTAATRTWWFPDNTVLCNFAAVDRLSLLEKVLDGRGRWTQAVAYEAERSSRHLPPLRTVAADGWLGEPIEIDDPRETELVDRLRRLVFGGNPRRPLQHLGEAETLTLIQHRSAFAESVWITDDGEAGRFARRKGITVLDTVDIIREAVAGGVVVAHEGHRLLCAMTSRGRHLRGVPRRPEDLLR
jgi:predicted nucleic acid-binding protein